MSDGESKPGFTVWIDNDACPRRVREIVFKASARCHFQVKMVANSYMQPPHESLVEMICVGSEFDAADNLIAEEVIQGDLVITADVPLAARVVEKDAVAISPRGQQFDSESIHEKLAMRNLYQELRSSGDISGGPSAFNQKDIAKFSALFNQLIDKMRK